MVSTKTDRTASPKPDRARHVSPAAIRRKSRVGAAEPIAALNRIRITEASLPLVEREPLVDLRLHCPEVAIADWVCPFLRRTVADMVNRAQSVLPAGHRLRIGSALRTLPMQQAGWNSYCRRLRKEHPEWSIATLRRAVNRYFAPYDQPAPPGHCTGGAVDVAILGPDGEPLDMTSPTKGWEGAYTWSDRISAEARANRMMMVEAMLSAGFSNCREEFWHYSYGDSAWAVRVGESCCPYGWTYPPLEVAPIEERASAPRTAVEVVRDEDGRPLSAAVTIKVASAANTPAALAAAIRWANAVPLEIRVLGPVSCLFLGSPKSGWREVDADAQQRDERLIQLSPISDTLHLTDVPPPAPAEEPEKK